MPGIWQKHSSNMSGTCQECGRNMAGTCQELQGIYQEVILGIPGGITGNLGIDQESSRNAWGSVAY